MYLALGNEVVGLKLFYFVLSQSRSLFAHVAEMPGSAESSSSVVFFRREMDLKWLSRSILRFKLMPGQASRTLSWTRFRTRSSL